MKTKAAILRRINHPPAIEELLIPELKTGQVLVKIAYSGVCRSQLNQILGFKGKDQYLPHTLGHEGSGIVLRLGPGVKKVKSTDHVALTWIKARGRDIASCVYQKSDGSVVNSGAISTFMQYAVISENRLVKIPKRMPLGPASLLGCAVLTGAGIVRNTAKVKSGNTVAIFGIGGIGLSAILASKLAQAKTIIAVDLFDHKLRQARKAGATHIINAAKEDVVVRINEFVGRKGLDYAIETAGTVHAMETAFQVTRASGGLCVLAGNLAAGERISMDPFELIKGKRIIGSWGGESSPDKDIPYYADLYLSGRLDLEVLITQTYRLQELACACRDLSQGKVGRPLIDMGL